MPYKFFTVSIDVADQAEAALNAFLRSHNILSVEKCLIERQNNAYWHFCISYSEAVPVIASTMQTQAPAASSPTFYTPQRKSGSTKPRIDYSEVLTPEQFAVYIKLRTRREEVAGDFKVPVYMVFNNAQLAEIVQKRVTTKEGMGAISGVSDGRVAKYSNRFLDILQEEFKSDAMEQKSA